MLQRNKTKDIQNIFALSGQQYELVIEMYEFDESLLAMEFFNLDELSDWCIYPKLHPYGSTFLMVDIVQGCSLRCPVYAIRVSITDLNTLYQVASELHEHFHLFNPNEFLSLLLTVKTKEANQP